MSQPASLFFSFKFVFVASALCEGPCTQTLHLEQGLEMGFVFRFVSLGNPEWERLERDAAAALLFAPFALSLLDEKWTGEGRTPSHRRTLQKLLQSEVRRLRHSAGEAEEKPFRRGGCGCCSISAETLSLAVPPRAPRFAVCSYDCPKKEPPRPLPGSPKKSNPFRFLLPLDLDDYRRLAEARGARALRLQSEEGGPPVRELFLTDCREGKSKRRGGPALLCEGFLSQRGSPERSPVFVKVVVGGAVAASRRFSFCVACVGVPGFCGWGVRTGGRRPGAFEGALLCSHFFSARGGGEAVEFRFNFNCGAAGV